MPEVVETLKYPAISEYNFESPPPEGHPDLGIWIWQLFEAAYAEKDRLGLMDRWVSNYKLYRGDHWGNRRFRSKNKDKISISLFMANVQRTVANITSKNPVAEIVDMDGNVDGADQLLSVKLRKWWNETEQQILLSSSCQQNEVYGITVEKFGWSTSRQAPYVVLVDPYSFFPAPNCPEDLQEAPYLIHAFAMPVETIEAMFGPQEEDVLPDDVRTILGRDDREDVRPNASMASQYAGVVHTNYKNPSVADTTGQAWSRGEGLVVECWLKDNTVVVDEAGNKSYKYPDGVRVVTITNRGKIVLSDMINPNINLEINPDNISESYAWGRFPFTYRNSYTDTASMWGFSAAEQVGDLNLQIDTIMSRLVAYVNICTFPPMVVEAGCGISNSMIKNKPGLLLRPNRPGADIRFLQVPPLSPDFYRVVEMLERYHDRVYQIEDADRGVQPSGVIAASAIVALQERNAVLIQHKIRAMEYIARERGRWAISFLQNFGTKTEKIDVRGNAIAFQGVALAGRKFNYIVESGSTVAQTSIQRQEQSLALYEKGAIDRKALLENLNYPGWKEIIERSGESQLDQALQILIAAGLDENAAKELKMYLMQPQNGQDAQQSGQTSVSPSTPKPGMPRAMQGRVAA